MDLINIKEENDLQNKNEIKNSPNKKELDVKKKQMTLNLESSKPRKRTLITNSNVNNNLNTFSSIIGQSYLNTPIGRVTLDSPDVQMLAMNSPEYIEKFILSSNTNNPNNLTPTPSLANKRFIDTNQFIRQLNDLNESSINIQMNNTNNSNSDSSRPPSNASSTNYYHNQEQFNIQDDNSNATSLVSGNNSNCSFNTSNNSANNQSFNENADLEAINMLKNQDLSKLERKRLRNRIAASKCRKRKLERISNLEDRVQKLKNENHSLNQEVMQLKEKHELLRIEVLSHKKNGCTIPINF